MLFKFSKINPVNSNLSGNEFFNTDNIVRVIDYEDTDFGDYFIAVLFNTPDPEYRQNGKGYEVNFYFDELESKNEALEFLITHMKAVII